MDDEELYEFVAGGDSCDSCVAMAGFHAEPPSVPLHENCGCQVIPPSENCAEEIRNVQSDSDSYFITVSAGAFDNCGLPATTLDFEASESFGDYFGFEYGGEDAIECPGGGGGGGGGESADIPANSRGSASITVEMISTLCIGEKWQICTHPDPVAGTHITETYIGDVGGYSESPAGVVGVEVQAESCG